jgi:mannose-6-phosphate isomerase-like protein (cupin superfamily)
MTNSIKHTRYDEIKAFTTKDQSQIRELMHPSQHGVQKQSLAEASLDPGVETILHKHHEAEELYYITAGRGMMTLGEDIFEVGVGDTICITPGTPHRIKNISEETLRIVCSCVPAYAHEDTELLE